jgi:tetratricopeptide (TPR) repeat protein
MEKAIALNPEDPRLYYEMDTLYEAAGWDPKKRLDFLARNHEVVVQRDDAAIREIVLHIQLGNCDRAIELLQGRHFHNWEGNRGIHDIYADAHLHRGHRRFRAGQFHEALESYQAALEYPDNLEVGKPYHDRREGEIHYFIGAAREKLGQRERALASFERALERIEKNPLETQYFQALALNKLGKDDEARRVFQRLVQRGQARLKASSGVDYFAKFGERQSKRSREAQAHYWLGLGYRGLGREEEAGAQFRKVLQLSPAHLGAGYQLAAR